MRSAAGTSSWWSTADRPTARRTPPSRAEPASSARRSQATAARCAKASRPRAARYILTLDADLSHDPDFIVKLWRSRERAEVVIASRYVRGGVAYMPRSRLILSRVLNAFFARGLGLPVRDLSSGFRLYRAAAVQGLAPRGHELRGARGDPGQDPRRRVADHRDPVHVLPARERLVARAHRGVRHGVPAGVLPPVEAAQLDRIGRLRRARLLQPDSAATLVAAPAPRDHLRLGSRRRQDARHRLRLERDSPIDQRRRRSRHPAQQAALHAALRRSARAWIDLRAAGSRRPRSIASSARR